MYFNKIIVNKLNENGIQLHLISPTLKMLASYKTKVLFSIFVLRKLFFSF